MVQSVLCLQPPFLDKKTNHGGDVLGFAREMELATVRGCISSLYSSSVPLFFCCSSLLSPRATITSMHFPQALTFHLFQQLSSSKPSYEKASILKPGKLSNDEVTNLIVIHNFPFIPTTFFCQLLGQLFCSQMGCS